MTVIAWDGRTLAADKRSINSGLARTVTKIYRVGDSVVAIAGNLDQGLLMVEWVRNGCNPETFPDSQKGKDDWATVVVADANGLRSYERTPYPIVVEDKFWASGTGRDFALAAMHLGKPAREAVEIASLFQSDCGNGCDSFDVAAVSHDQTTAVSGLCFDSCGNRCGCKSPCGSTHGSIWNQQ